MEFNDFVFLQNDEIIKMAKEYYQRLNKKQKNKDLPILILDTLVKTKKFAHKEKLNRLEFLINKIEKLFEIKPTDNKKIKVVNFCDGIKQTINLIIEYIKEFENIDLIEQENYKQLQELLEIVKGLINLLGECKFRR